MILVLGAAIIATMVLVLIYDDDIEFHKWFSSPREDDPRSDW